MRLSSIASLNADESGVYGGATRFSIFGYFSVFQITGV